jgi:hypothetical protein
VPCASSRLRIGMRVTKGDANTVAAEDTLEAKRAEQLQQATEPPARQPPPHHALHCHGRAFCGLYQLANGLPQRQASGHTQEGLVRRLAATDEQQVEVEVEVHCNGAAGRRGGPDPTWQDTAVGDEGPDHGTGDHSLRPPREGGADVRVDDAAATCWQQVARVVAGR